MTDDEKKRRGAKSLWRICVRYWVEDDQTGRDTTKWHYMDNRLPAEVMQARTELFSVGLMLPVDPGHWIVIMPNDIKEVHIYKQKKFEEQ